MRLGFLVLVGLVGAGAALADEAVRTGAAAFGDWRSDAPGVRRLITSAALPAPFATRSAANMSQHAARTGADIPKAPAGFTVDLFASGLNMPRVIRVAPNGDIFVAETGAGRVRVFRSGGAGAGPAQGEIFADGLQRPYGIAFYPSGENPRFVYVASPGLRCPLSLSQRRDESLRPCREDRKLAERRRTLDPRPRLFA
jgi:glucose/arabinose dehydrogenase